VTREDAHTKASRYLVEGRVVLESVQRRRVHARVRGTDRFHHVHWTGDNGWQCDCPALRATCSHINAVQRVVCIPPPKETP
jgi:uncharacterized Zn finger protein